MLAILTTLLTTGNLCEVHAFGTIRVKVIMSTTTGPAFSDGRANAHAVLRCRQCSFRPPSCTLNVHRQGVGSLRSDQATILDILKPD